MKQRQLLKNPGKNWKKPKQETYHFYQVTVKWIAWLGEPGSLYNLPTPIPPQINKKMKVCVIFRKKEKLQRNLQAVNEGKKILNVFPSNRLLYFKCSSLKYSRIFLSPTHLQLIMF